VPIDSDRIKPHNLHTNPATNNPREQEKWQGMKGMYDDIDKKKVISSAPAATAAARETESGKSKSKKRGRKSAADSKESKESKGAKKAKAGKASAKAKGLGSRKGKKKSTEYDDDNDDESNHDDEDDDDDDDDLDNFANSYEPPARLVSVISSGSVADLEAPTGAEELHVPIDLCDEEGAYFTAE
jgi:hypothetical protein